MPIVDLADLPRAGKLIGLDVGAKTIGVAAGDVATGVASPVETIRRTKFAADGARLAQLIAARGAVGVVIGLPLNMDGGEGPRAQASRATAANLAKLTEAPIALWDERLSTAAVERAMIAQDLTRKRRAELVDKLAAAHILEGAMDRLRRLPPIEARLTGADAPPTPLTHD